MKPHLKKSVIFDNGHYEFSLGFSVNEKLVIAKTYEDKSDEDENTHIAINETEIMLLKAFLNKLEL